MPNNWTLPKIGPQTVSLTLILIHYCMHLPPVQCQWMQCSGGALQAALRR